MDDQHAPPQRPKNLCAVADYLLSKQSGVKARDGVLNESRVTFFRGKGAVNALLKPEFRNSAAGKEFGDLTRETAGQLLGSMIPHQFFLKVEKSTEPEAPRNTLSIVQYQSFAEDGIFLWRYEGSKLRAHLAAAGMLAIVLAGVMFPLWPAPLRLGVWYLSVGILMLLGLFFAMAIVRLILFGITYVILKPGIWLFPNLFEDVGFVDSFIPLWGWHEPESAMDAKGAKDAGEEAQEHVEVKGTTTTTTSSTTTKVTKRRPMVEEVDDEHFASGDAAEQEQ